MESVCSRGDLHSPDKEIRKTATEGSPSPISKAKSEIVADIDPIHTPENDFCEQEVNNEVLSQECEIASADAGVSSVAGSADTADSGAGIHFDRSTLKNMVKLKDSELKQTSIKTYIDATTDLVAHAFLHKQFLQILHSIELARREKLKLDITSSCPSIYVRTKSVGVQTATVSCRNTRHYGRLARCIKQLVNDKICVHYRRPTQEQTTLSLPRIQRVFPQSFNRCNQCPLWLQPVFTGIHYDWCDKCSHVRQKRNVRGSCLRSLSCGPAVKSAHAHLNVPSLQHKENFRTNYTLRYTTKSTTFPSSAAANARISRTFERHLRRTSEKMKSFGRGKSETEDSSSSSSSSFLEQSSNSSYDVPSKGSCSDNFDEEKDSSTTTESSDTSSTETSDLSGTCSSDESKLQFTWEELLEIPGCVATSGFIMYGHVLGEGVYGRVYSATIVNGLELIPVAVKIFKSNNKIEDIETEVEALLALKDTGTTPQLYGVTKKCEHKFGLVMELIGQGITLHDFLVKVSNKTDVQQATWLSIIFALATSLEKIHDLDVRVNDIKTDNVVLVKANEARFVDMGFATKGYDMSMGSCSGDYLAPEVRAGEKGSKAADMYSLGHILDIVADETDCGAMRQWSKMCMREEPSERPTITELVKLINDTMRAREDESASNAIMIEHLNEYDDAAVAN